MQAPRPPNSKAQVRCFRGPCFFFGGSKYQQIPYLLSRVAVWMLEFRWISMANGVYPPCLHVAFDVVVICRDFSGLVEWNNMGNVGSTGKHDAMNGMMDSGNQMCFLNEESTNVTIEECIVQKWLNCRFCMCLLKFKMLPYKNQSF